MRARRSALVFVVIGIFVFLYFFSGFPYLAKSTLNGGMIVGNGITVRQLPKNLFSVEPGITRLSDHSLVIAVSASGGESCKPRFTSIQLDDRSLILTEDKTPICVTMQIDSYYFLVTALQPLSSLEDIYVQSEDSQKSPRLLDLDD